MKRALCSVACLVLQACSHLTPPGVTALNVPPNWRERGGTAPVQSNWWSAFGDGSLDRLVAEALANNLDLRLATERLKEAHAMVSVQRASEWPTLTAVAGGNRSKQVSDVTLKPYLSTNHEFELRASYEVDLWGRIHDLTDATIANESSVRATRAAVELSVASTIVSDYISLRATDAQLELARRTAESRRHSYRLAKAREKSGYSGALETAQAEAEWRATTQTVPKLELSQRRQEEALQVILGRTQGAIERGLALEALSPITVPDAGLPSELLRRRPDIASAESQIAAADSQLASARGRLLPSINLLGSAGQVASSILHGDPFTIWSLGGSILAPIFNGGQLRSGVDAAASRREQSLISYKRVVLLSFSEVEIQLLAFSKLQEQLQENQLEVTAVARSLHIARRRHAVGYSSYLDELLAERSLFAVEQNALQLRADVLVSEVSLYRALGGGWSSDHSNESRPAAGADQISQTGKGNLAFKGNAN